MIRHIVMWRLKDFAEGNEKKANALIMKQMLEALNGKIDGLIKAEAGLNFTDGGYDVCLYSELESKEALDYYQGHPEHVVVKEFVGKVVSDRAVCDSEI